MLWNFWLVGFALLVIWNIAVTTTPVIGIQRDFPDQTDTISYSGIIKFKSDDFKDSRTVPEKSLIFCTWRTKR